MKLNIPKYFKTLLHDSHSHISLYKDCEGFSLAFLLCNYCTTKIYMRTLFDILFFSSVSIFLIRVIITIKLNSPLITVFNIKSTDAVSIQIYRASMNEQFVPSMPIHFLSAAV